MEKELSEMTFDELVREGVGLELDAVVEGLPLKKRVWAVMELATRWAHERAQKPKA